MSDALSPNKWLKDFQEKLEADAKIASEDLAQAQPVYYAIRDYRLDIVPDGYGDITRYADHSNCVDYSPREALQSLIDGEYATVDDIINSDEGQMYNIAFDENDSVDTSVTDTNICWFLDDSPFADHLERHEFTKTPFIVPDTMFLTQEEAQRHLKANYYHYTKDAHTYAMTAWRSPEVEDLLKLLRSIDFDESTIKLKPDEVQ